MESRSLGLSLVLAVLLCGSAALAQSGSSSPANARAQADQEFQLGFQLAQQGKLPEALPHMKQAVRLRPSFAPGHYNLAYIYQMTGKDQDAEREYRQCLKYDPRAANAEFNLGILLHKRGSPEAAAHCRKAERLDPRMIGPACPK